MKAICPHCETSLSKLEISPVTGKAPDGSGWNCLVFACPSCRKALSADLNVSAIGQEIINTILKR